MCKLCCISFDSVGKTNLAKSALNKCYKGCIESKINYNIDFDKMPDARRIPSP